MKSYTDLQQSKKLAEILSLESADMCYSNDGTAIKIDANSYNVRKKMWQDVEVIPCWSLAALLELIPVTAEYKDMFIRLRVDKGNIGHDEYAMWYDDLQTNLSTDIEAEADNPIDACVAMILKLHEQKLL